ncbi:MAG: hypothetical protein LAN18_00525 [Acidobacteriia bacterium]|nr:hypothetical protein [Terriglobia bacterium]
MSSPKKAATPSRFLREVVTSWIGALGGILSIVFTVSAFYVSNRTQRALYVVLAFAAVLWAAYSAWSRTFDELEAELAKHTNPILRGEIEELYISVYSPEQLQGSDICDIVVLLKVVLYNDSECSTTTRAYGLTVKDADGTHNANYLGEAENCLIELGRPYQDSSGELIGSKTERPNDLLTDTAIRPIVRGVHRVGWLRFKVLGMNPASAETGLYCLTAIDSFGINHDVVCKDRPPLGKGTSVHNLNA